jgi:hypothetical protein
MLKAILADHNLAGHLRALHDRIWLSPPWTELWQALSIRVETFESLGISPTLDDRSLWRYCQQEGLVLFTANRNSDGESSLNAALRDECTLDSLPVITLGDENRLWQDNRYAIQVAKRILEILYDIEQYLGAGRLYVPEPAR